MKRTLFVVICLFCVTPACFAQQRKASPPAKTQKTKTPDELLAEEELEHQRKEAIKEIELTTQLLDETGASAKASLNRLNLLTQQLQSRRKVIALLGQEVAGFDKKIHALNEEIGVLEKDLTATKEHYVKSMQSQQQEHRTAQYKMLLVLSAENLSQSYRRMRYLREYSDWQKEEAERIVRHQEEIARRRAELEESREEKQSLLAQREEESKQVEREEQEQRREVQALNRQQKDLQRHLQEQKRLADALNRQIEGVILEEAQGSGERTAQKTGAGSEAGRIEYRMNEKEIHLSKDFASNKGKLPYPVTGGYAIVSRFGQHQHQELSYVRTNNNGIDIQTTAGSEARTIFHGVVTRIFVMPGFNNNVIIRHGDYLTVYCNLSEVYVKAGDPVTTRQLIGKIYADPERNNETILHFQLWKERIKLNPAQWLR
jgi:septal ring factor EnvC (AmiA/AmiB activator)